MFALGVLFIRVPFELGRLGGGGLGLKALFLEALVGGSWVVISGAISRVTVVITHIRGLRTLLITTHEPPSIPRTIVVLSLRVTLDSRLYVCLYVLSFTVYIS